MSNEIGPGEWIVLNVNRNIPHDERAKLTGMVSTFRKCVVVTPGERGHWLPQNLTMKTVKEETETLVYLQDMVGNYVSLNDVISSNLMGELCGRLPVCQFEFRSTDDTSTVIVMKYPADWKPSFRDVLIKSFLVIIEYILKQYQPLP